MAETKRMTYAEWEKKGIENFLTLLVKRRNPYAAKPSMTQEAFDALPHSTRCFLTCNGGCGKVVSDHGMLCVECGIMVHEGTFPQYKKKSNQVTIE